MSTLIKRLEKQRAALQTRVVRIDTALAVIGEHESVTDAERPGTAPVRATLAGKIATLLQQQKRPLKVREIAKPLGVSSQQARGALRRDGKTFRIVRKRGQKRGVRWDLR